MALTRSEVVAEALRLSDAEGVDALSLRTLAARLGVQAPTLYWHVKNKGALLDALSDAIADEAVDGLQNVPDGVVGDEWIAAALRSLRRALLAHRDGARIVSDARDSLRRSDFAELVIARLVGSGVEPGDAWLRVLVGVRYTLGHVLAEQGPDAPSDEVAADFRRRTPLTAAEASAYFRSHTADELFDDALRILLR